MSIFFAPSPAYAVRLNDELRRVETLTRRQWSEEDAENMTEQLTQLLKTPGGTMSLRSVQGIALAEIGIRGGLFGIIRVGAGKTLISLLAASVAEARRPVLLIPAKLVTKTQRDMILLSKHWLIPKTRIITYEWLGRAQAADALDSHKPDVIVCDEAHKLKNKSAAVTRRVARYMKANPTTKMIVMSGTIAKRSLHDYAHLIRWALKTDVPLPDGYNDLELWADALDERKGMLRRADPGALRVLCNTEENQMWPTNPREWARRAYRRRLIDTSGVVSTQETSVDASITVRCVEPPKSTAIDGAFEHLRKNWETPDGWPLADALQVYRHAREIALGFYYKWEPRPPRAWMEARKTWCAFVRETLSHSRALDSELQVKRQFPASRELIAWDAVKHSFKPNTTLVWLDNSVVDYCKNWLNTEIGILWTEHVLFAKRLSAETGTAYYGSGNVGDAEKHSTAKPMILSIEAGREGLNLQGWHSNCIISPPPNGERWEQLLGRTHRDGQEADEVSFDVAGFSIEHVEAFWQARSDAEYVAASLGSPQKLLVADYDFPTSSEVASLGGARWRK